MSKLLTLNNIAVSGLNTDIAAWELPPENISYGVNFRSMDVSFNTVGGTVLWSDPLVSFSPGFLLNVRDVGGDYFLVMGRTAVRKFDGATWTLISATGAYTALGPNDELLWSGCMMGSIPIINNPKVYPQYYDPSTGITLKPLRWSATVADWDTANQQCKTIRAHKNFLFGLNLTENGVEYPDAFRWSHPADANALPVTWDDTDPFFLAGKASIGANSGKIITGLSLRDAFVIYSENGINSLNSSGDEYVWRRDQLSSMYGPLSQNSVVEVKGVHYMIVDGDVIRNDGNNIESIMLGKIKRRFSSRLSSEYYNRSYAIQVRAYNEVWFCVVDGQDSSYPDLAYVYNWKDDTWSIREIASGIAYSEYGSIIQARGTWANKGGTWQSNVAKWTARGNSPLDDSVVGVNNSTGAVYNLDTYNEAANVGCRIERIGIQLDSTDNVKMVKRVYPRISGNTPVLVQIGSQAFANADVVWEPGVIFNPKVDRKVDVRTTGSHFCYRYDNQGVGRFRLTGMDFEYENVGKR